MDNLVDQTVLALGRIKRIGKEKDDLVQVLDLSGTPPCGC